MKFCMLITVIFFGALPFAALAQDTQDVKTAVERGKLIFEQNCLACHQADGSGVPHLAPPLIKGTFVGGDKEKVIGIVLHGLENVEIKGEYYANPMPSFDYLSDQEIADVLSFVRTSFSNEASEITSEEVTKARADTKTK
ncbi:MAG TPA: cytochrome c [Chryseosolibacter sp.]